jgi:hypothetical protein
MARDGVLLDNFSGGLNNVTDPSIIAENELAEATNVILTRNGKLASRYPFLVEKAKPSGATKLTPLGYFRNIDGVTQLVAATQDKTYLYNFSSDSWTQIATFAAADITTYYNRLYLVNPAGYGGYYHKNTSTSAYEFITLNDSSTGMPAGNQIHYTKGRIYISSRALNNTSTLRYSNVPTLGASIDQFPTSNYIDVNEGDGELLLKIVEGNSELFLFRSHSTWRLAFGASAEPTDGALTQLSSSVGVDNEFGVVAGENYHAVMYAGTLYRLAGYNYYPFNDSNKVEFKTTGSGYTINTAISKVGQYLLAWYYGSIYCFDTEANAWTQWTSSLDAAYFIEAPRGTVAAANEPLVGFGVGGDSDEQSLLKFALKYDGDSTNETINCRIKTKTYDAGLPTKFKRMFGWDLLVVAVNYVTASIVAIEEQTPATSWTTLETYTWSGAEAANIPWSPVGTTPTQIQGLVSENPVPSIVKVAGKTTFKRAYFTVEFANKGTAATAPSRLDGIVLYMTSGRKSSVERVS